MYNMLCVCKHDPSSNRTRPSYKFTTGIGSSADAQHKSVLESDALVSRAVFAWAGGSVLVGRGYKVVVYVDTRTRKAVIQSPQLLGLTLSSQRMCQQLREVSATWRGLASAVFHLLACTLCHVMFLDVVYDCTFKHLLFLWTLIIESGWTVKSIIGWALRTMFRSYVLENIWW